MKKSFVFLLSVLLIGCSDRVRVKASKATGATDPICDASSISKIPYAGGDGSALKPYLICTPTQLAAIASRASDFASDFMLLSDIDMAGVSFDGIGSSATPFKGRFHGNSKNITNLTILRLAGNEIGFFNQVQNAYIKDLTFVNASVTANGLTNAGVVIGKSVESFIKNVTVTNATLTGEENIGALAGHAKRTTFLATSVSGSVSGEQTVGGAIGLMEESVLLGSTITAAVTGVGPYYGVGGAAGVVDIGARLQNVSVTSNVTADFSVGGMIGESYADLTIFRSSFDGTVTADSYAGGIAGAIYRPATIGSVSLEYTLIGERYLGGLIGDYYGDSNVSDVMVSGTISTSGATQDSVGGFFGSMDDWGTVRNSLGVVSITGSAEYAGGFVGRRFSGADPFTVDDVAVVSSVVGDSASNIVGLFTGGGFDQTYTGTSYFWSGGTCTNNGAGNCLNPVQTPVASLTSFYDNSTLPFSNWDFTDIWQTNSGSYPTLRQTQLHAPVVSHSCPSALKDLPYFCEISVTDADLHEFHAIDLQTANTCQWMFPIMNNIVGTPSAAGSCETSFQVTDGTFASATQTITIRVHDEITITPIYNTTSFAYDLGSAAVTTSAGVTTFTITNTTSDPLTAFSISGLTEGSYSRTGGSCGASILPGSSCTVDIDFVPTAIGAHLDRMQINYNNGSSAVILHYGLSGEGY